MTYRLFIMDRAYSSWSLRGYLMLEAFGLKYETVHAEWPGPGWDAMLPRIAPARTVPAMEIEEEVIDVIVIQEPEIADASLSLSLDTGNSLTIDGDQQRRLTRGSDRT